MIALASIFLQHFNAITAEYAAIDLFSLPAWKCAALVEHWAFKHVEEGKESVLEQELQRHVSFTWIGGHEPEAITGYVDPARWQTNEPGESLLSAHRKVGR